MRKTVILAIVLLLLGLGAAVLLSRRPSLPSSKPALPTAPVTPSVAPPVPTGSASGTSGDEWDDHLSPAIDDLNVVDAS